MAINISSWGVGRLSSSPQRRSARPDYTILSRVIVSPTPRKRTDTMNGLKSSAAMRYVLPVGSANDHGSFTGARRHVGRCGHG